MSKVHPVDSGPVDIFALHSGDVAGCTCPKCTPWGKTFIELAHEIERLLHAYSPDCKVIATNQNLTNQGHRAIIEYLNQHDSGWLFALRYGPGGNEMDTYNRGPVNPVWFEYEGFGKTGNFLKHLHHSLPRRTKILLFTDITHWIRSQNGVPRPDVAMATVYGRRAWNARPRRLHEVAVEMLHYAEGDMFYSEGMFDDFNKWLWLRLLWNPNLSHRQITEEYCTYWFGPEAARDIADAIYTMEENMERQVLGNPGIPKAIRILSRARRKIPRHLLSRDYRWRVMMQKALLDRYIQMWLERGDRLKHKAREILVSSSANPKKAIQEAIKILSLPQETRGMRRVKEKVRRLGEETNRIIGYREAAYFNLDGFDLAEIGWWRKRLQEGLETGDRDQMANSISMVLRYEDSGQRGLYERVGWPWGSANLLPEAMPIVGFFPFKGPARLSNFGFAYSWGQDRPRLVFRFQGLDAGKDYVIRISTGFHCDDLSKALRDEPRQSIQANGVVLGETAVPLGRINLQEFRLPGELVSDGTLTAKVESTGGSFPMAGLSEIWIIPEDQLAWTCKSISAI